MVIRMWLFWSENVRGEGDRTWLINAR